MRLRNLFLQDMRFQARYGFYFLYAVLTVLYVAILSAVPEGWREKTAAILIFSDPASMGLFFMGAIVLLEKSQHTPWAFAVSPVRPMEYVLGKMGSLMAVSLAVVAVLALAAGVGHLLMVLAGTAMASALFTLSGIVVASKISSLNQFILWTVPVEAVSFVPAVLHLFKITPAWLRYYPVNVCMEMVSGTVPSPVGILMAAAWTAVLLRFSGDCVLDMWSNGGGGKG